MKVLILGTGQAQADAIQYIREKGHTVYGCSSIAGDSAEQHCDYFQNIDITDIDAIRKYTETHKIDLVYSVGSDLAIPTAMLVSEQLGLPHYLSSLTARLCHNKALFRKQLGRDFPGNIGSYVIHEIKELPKEIEYPCMLKPVDSQGQRGCFKVNNASELKAAFEKAIVFSEEKEVIVEQYIQGDEISVNGYVRNGNILVSVISDRCSYSEYPGGIIKKHILPSKYEKTETSEKVLDLAKRIIEAVNITNGPVYFQMKVNQGTPFIIETAPRLDGCHMWRLIKEYCDIDLLAMTLDPLLENCIGTKQYILEFLSQQPGTVFTHNRYETKGADYLQWYYAEKEIVKSTNGYMEKCGYMIKKETI